MKKFFLMMVLTIMMFSVGVKAQRPVGDTVVFGEGDFLYDSVYYRAVIYSDYSSHLEDDLAFTWYKAYRMVLILNSREYRGINTYDFYLNFPELFSAPHISGQQFYTPGGKDDSIKVIGLAICPLIKPASGYPNPVSIEHEYPIPVIDTTMDGRLTEYVQLYSPVGDTTLVLRAEGPWRIEDPHRYLQFPAFLQNTPAGSASAVRVDSVVNVPLYEVMFDTGVVINDGTYVVAGTYNNNGVRWSNEWMDGHDFIPPMLCFEHPSTSYSSCRIYAEPSDDPTPLRPYWFKTENTSWIVMPNNDTSYWITGIPQLSHYNTLSYFWAPDSIATRSYLNIFPILDTIWGSPCMPVTGMQCMGLDSTSATVIWSADERHQRWEVRCWAADSTLGEDTVQTVTLNRATLSPLRPGTEYRVSVRGLCEGNNYSPWCDTLLIVTPEDTTAVDPFRPDTIIILGTREGNLDHFTRMMPNPADGRVSVFSSYRLKSVSVYDLGGRCLIEQDAEGLFATVDVSGLPRGVYMVAIHTQQGVAGKRLVVDHR